MRKLGAVVAAAGLIVAIAAPTYAVWVRPSQVPLLNAAGEDSTCELTTRGSTFVRNDVRRLKHTAEVFCETAWARQRIGLSAFVVQDGQRVPLYSGGRNLRVRASEPVAATSTVGAICEQNTWGLPWDPQPGVTYQIILSSRATVKATADYTGEPWSARAEKLVEVTC